MKTLQNPVIELKLWLEMELAIMKSKQYIFKGTTGAVIPQVGMVGNHVMSSRNLSMSYALHIFHAPHHHMVCIFK